MVCRYCKDNDAVDHEVINPHTKEVNPTCPVCEYGFKLLEVDDKKYSWLNQYGNYTVFWGVVALPFGKFIMGGTFIFVGLSMKFLKVYFIGRNSDARFYAQRQFAKEHGLKAL